MAPKNLNAPKANVPSGPCFGTVIDDSGELLPIVSGMALFIIEDPNNLRAALPFRLVSVSKHRIVLRLKGSDGSVYDYPFVNNTKILVNQAAVKAHNTAVKAHKKNAN
jgi:hypothetical protein